MKTISTLLLVVTVLFTVSCKKDKKNSEPAPEPPPTANEEEVITTFKLMLTDSATNTLTTYLFKDPDGAGGQPAYYGPTNVTQTDSIISLGPDKTYYGQIILLDETKTPVDSTSNEVDEEGQDHMFFYNNGANTILNVGNPYTVQLNGSAIKITYTDLDAGTPQRGIGLKTKWRTSSATGTAKYNLNITLRHQPDSKDGTYAPGDSDVSVDFKVRVN